MLTPKTAKNYSICMVSTSVVCDISVPHALYGSALQGSRSGLAKSYSVLRYMRLCSIGSLGHFQHGMASKSYDNYKISNIVCQLRKPTSVGECYPFQKTEWVLEYSFAFGIALLEDCSCQSEIETR